MFDLNSYKQARDVFELLIQRNNNLFNPYLKLGIIYQTLDMEKKALQFLLKAHEINPISVMTLQIIARIFRTINDKKNSLKYTELAHNLDPYNFLFLHNLKELKKEPLANEEKEFILKHISNDEKITIESKSYGHFLLSANANNQKKNPIYP